MPLAHRVIPCLDVKAGRVVKGIKFQNLRDVGDPAELAWRYEEEGADEVVFLDISATLEERQALWHVVERTAAGLSIPLTVGGGIKTVDDIHRALRSGADKTSMNTAAVERPALLREGADEYGSQCIVIAIDAKRAAPSRWEVHTHSGTKPTGLDATAWARTAEREGAGEILLTSMDRDGTTAGYDLDLLRAVHDATNIPVIASGGAGSARHLVEAIQAGADAALAASIFHYRTITVAEVKRAMTDAGVEVRP